MAKKANKKITAAQMKKSYGHYGEFENEIHVSLDDTEEPMIIRVRSGLGMDDYGNMIVDIAQACFSVRDGYAVYAPYLVDFARALSLAKYYTDLEIPENQDVFWRFWNKHRMTEKITAIIPYEINDIFERADEMVAQIVGSKPDAADKLIGVIDVALQKLLNIEIDQKTISDFLTHRDDIMTMVDAINNKNNELLGMADMQNQKS